MKIGARHLKEHPKISNFTKLDGYWLKPKGMVHLVWIGGTGVLQSILSSLILKVYHASGFKPITIKFGEFTNFWMLFNMTCSIFNLIDIEYSYQEKYVRTQSPARLEHDQFMKSWSRDSPSAKGPFACVAYHKHRERD